jgi:hypothetical protein
VRKERHVCVRGRGEGSDGASTRAGAYMSDSGIVPECLTSANDTCGGQHLLYRCVQKRCRSDVFTKQKNYYDNIIILSIFNFLSSYKTCLNINYNFIRTKYRYHYLNRNVRSIRKSIK